MFLTIYILVFIMDSGPPPRVHCTTKSYNSIKTVKREEREKKGPERGQDRQRKTERQIRNREGHTERHADTQTQTHTCRENRPVTCHLVYQTDEELSKLWNM